MFLTLLVIFGILFELILIGVGVYYFLKHHPKPKTEFIKIKSELKPIVVNSPPKPRKVKITFGKYDGMYVPSNDEVPVKRSGGNLVPFGLTDEEKIALEMFYDRD